MGISHFIQTTQMKFDPDIIDLGIGHPHISLLPIRTIQSAAEICLSSGIPDFLQYGAEQGDGFLRSALATFLSQGYGSDLTDDSLFITNGASQGLDLVCTLFTHPGDTILVEEPSYFLALKIFSDHHLNIISIPTGKDGLNLDRLEELLQRIQPVMLYTVPTYQNPGGFTMSLDHRKRLAELSKIHKFLIVADEVYHYLYFTKPPPRAFAGYIHMGNIISLGSFSKILAPGLRLGWIVTSPDNICSLVNCGLLDSGGGLNPFTSAIVYQIVKSNMLNDNLVNLRRIYSSRASVMDTTLTQYLPDIEYQKPEGGYFFWIRLPEGKNAKTLLDQARNYKVNFHPGERFSSQDGLSNYLRLCFAYYDEDSLNQGIQRLQQAYNASNQSYR